MQAKRVPSQVKNKSADINLFSNPTATTGHTLLKRPEKLRAGSPIQTETFQPPHQLPPLERPPPYRELATPYTYRPPRHVGSPAVSTAGSVLNDSSKDKSNYMVLNREFDGRAIDPGMFAMKISFSYTKILSSKSRTIHVLLYHSILSLSYVKRPGLSSGV